MTATTFSIPSHTRPDFTYDIVISDDHGVVCDCRGYTRKVEIAYRTGVRRDHRALCRHALAVSRDLDIQPRQPDFYWVDLTTGEAFPITARHRGPEEHMLAYRRNGRLEPLELAVDGRFPRRPATPDRDYAGRMADLYRTPVSHLIITTTGDIPNRHWTRDEVQRAIRRAGATYKRGAVTADTSTLVAGARPAQSKIDRAHQLLTPIISYPALMSLLNHAPRSP